MKNYKRRMVGVTLLTLIVFFASMAEAVSKIRVEADGGYSNIVVKIDSNADENSCPNFIKYIKEMITDASVVLSEALDGRAYFKHVTIVVPPNWRDARCHTAIAKPTQGIAFKGADIKIAADSPIFGSSPFTHQSKGCGERGDLISLPQSFFTEWNRTIKTWGNPAKLFVKEWAKLRYGIFDEFGFAGDSLYPNFYKVQDRVLPTGSTDQQVRGTWLHINGTENCDPVSGDCYYDPEGENDQVTCSLGNMPFIPTVYRWCSQEQLTQPIAPTKHNILCGARPTIQVILENSDFSQLEGSNQLQRSLTPVFNLVREPLPEYVLIIETSSSMAGIWKWVRKAAQNLIRYELPDNTNLAVVTFGSEARVEHRMVQLNTESSRARLADTIPDSPNKLGRTDDRCVNCGVQVAMEQVLRGREAGGHLIVVTRGDGTSLTAEHQTNLKNLVSSYGVRISTVIVQDDSPPLSFYDDIAQLSDGRSELVMEGGSIMKMFTDVVEALRDVISVDSQDPANHPVTVYRQRLNRFGMGTSSSGAFAVDTTLGRETEFGVYVEDDEDHQIKSITFTDFNSKQYGPFNKMSSTFDVVNFKTINFNVGEEPPFDEAYQRGKPWQYRIDWYDSNETRDNVAVVRSKPSDVGAKGLLDISVWTNLASADNVTFSRLLAIYTKVSRGASPVSSARVHANITVELRNGSVVEMERIGLLDNGHGEPDLVSGDGVYSRFITNYPGMGKYRLNIDVDDNDGQATIVQPGRPLVMKPRKPGILTCCGSYIPVPVNRKELTGMFKRSIAGPVIQIVSIPGDKDKIRPAKIGDLHITVVKEKQQLLARWTAPGGDFNDGQVMTYRFVYSQKIEELLQPPISAPPLEGFKRTDIAGERVSRIINFKYYNQDYYVGLFAFDDTGNRGGMSNIVLVNVPPPAVTMPDTSAVEQVSGTAPDENWGLIGAIIGCLGVLLIILLLILYCRFIRRRPKFSKAAFANGLKTNGTSSPAASEQTDASSYESDMKASSNNHLVPVVVPNVSSTSFANNITPTYWSASQLLSEHEQRKQQQTEYRQSITDVLGAIHEDVDYGNPEVARYDPTYNYDYYSGQQQYQGYHPGYDNQMYDPHHRLSTSSVNVSEISGHPAYHLRNEDYNVMVEDARASNNRTGAKLLVHSDLSSSTLGITNPSLQGSMLSVNSGRPGNNAAKNRNITQV